MRGTRTGAGGAPAGAAGILPRYMDGVNGMGSIGRMLLVAGALLAAVGLLLVVAERFPGLRIGRLPGDLRVERGNFRFYFPLATSILLSAVISLVLWLVRRR